MTKRHKTIVRWSARTLAVMIILFGLPFYFGYGNPLPFIQPDYSAWDNLWLTIFPLMFLGLGLGWKYEKLGGYLVVVPLALGLVGGVILEGEWVWHMCLPLLAGAMFLYAGYKNNKGGSGG